MVLTVGHCVILSTFFYASNAYKKLRKVHSVPISIYGSQEHLVWGGTKGQRKQVVEIALRKKKNTLFRDRSKNSKDKEQERCNISIL